MDNYRRRPPMEGFSRPGELGGEAFDDDSVEGHIMDERDETPSEGIAKRRLDEDDTGGSTDDTEGHRGGARQAVDDEDDTEGHRANLLR